MLNSDAIAQLSQLKNDIRANKEFAQGTVRGSKGRFGFVQLDDDREAFLSPEQMQRVFPGDRVEVSITKNNKDQLEANLEKLLSSDLKEFVGTYLDRGKAHFVIPDVYMLSRWIFLAPKNRGDAKEADFIRCRITRHPFEDSKCQAKVLEKIGSPSDPHIERKYIVSKFQLRDQWNSTHLEQSELIQKSSNSNDNNLTSRIELHDLPFVTIDSASTKDMDDAVFAQPTEQGWRLMVAIADPSAGIKLDSPLGKEALARGQTVYLPGQAAPMIPHELATGIYSLVEGEKRPVLLAELDIGKDGNIDHFKFCSASITSAAKMSYEQVSQYIDGSLASAPLPDNIKASLQALDDLSNVRFSFREKHALVMEERPDFDYRVNEFGKIAEIVKTERNSAQRIVEEAMLATNFSAGKFFAEQKAPALFSSHLGFKPDRLQQVDRLIKEDLGDTDIDLAQLDNYVALIQRLQSKPEYSGLLSVLKRQLRPSELICEAKPHLGLGFQYYATITSPIRRYNDLYNHTVIKHILAEQPSNQISESEVEHLKEVNANSRQACRQLEQWLICQFMEQAVNQTFNGIVAMINSQGVGVKLTDNGVETYVQLRDKKNKEQTVDFNPERLALTVDGRTFQFDEVVSVTITEVDKERRQILARLNS